MNASFDLTREPWVPCLLLDGAPVELSLRDVFRRAHELAAIADQSPLVTASVHRLVIAIIHRCFGPASLEEWARLWTCGQFDAAVTDAYLDKWAHRFDLFHPERPFYQVTGLQYEPKPATELILECSNYGASVHLFEHRPTTTERTLDPGRAARALIATQAYKPGGLTSRAKGEPSSAGAAPLNARAIVLIRGDNLRETLLLNTLVYDPSRGEPIHGTGSDCPAWESPRVPSPGRRAVAGWLDLLTWQSRRVELRRHGSAVVEVVVAGGDDLPPDVQDPMVSWRRDPKKGMLAHRISEKRSVWRDSEALLVGGEAELAHVRPKACVQLASLELEGVIPNSRRLGLEVIGLAGDQAKILLVRHETLPVSRKLLQDQSAWTAIHEALTFLAAVGDALRDSLWSAACKLLSAGSRDPDPGDVRALTDSLATSAVYWSGLAPAFQRFLLDLDGEQDGGDQALSTIRSASVRLARNALDQTAAGFGESARALRASSVAANALQKRLAGLSKEME